MHLVSLDSEPRRSDALCVRPRRGLLPFAAVFAVIFALSLPRPASAAEIVHVVVKGQTLGRIAKRYNVSVDALRSINDLKRGQLLRPGTPLVIPQKGKEAEAAKKAAAMRQAQNAKKAAATRAAGGSADEDDDPKKAGKGGKDKAKGSDQAEKGKKGKGKAGGKDSEREADERNGYARKPKRAGFVHIQRGTERFDAQLLTRNGRLVPAALPGLSRMLRFGPSGAKIPIDPRLATLIGMVSDHFGGRVIKIVSGFRPYSPRQYTRHSKHNLGHAVDFAVEGVPNTVVRDFCRSFRNSGVGYYPNSSFVHMDVRTQKVYWVDYSGPGEAPRYDSPSAQAAADESTGDVDTHEAPAEGGSNTTTAPESQVPESSNGNSSGRGIEAPQQRAPGQVDPPSATSPAPAPEAPVH